jgi:hypothetical protein
MSAVYEGQGGKSLERFKLEILRVEANTKEGFETGSK